jgi:hypothetical protein
LPGPSDDVTAQVGQERLQPRELLLPVRPADAVGHERLVQSKGPVPVSGFS